MAESEEDLKSLLMKVKDESENSWLKAHIQKKKIRASGPIGSVQFSSIQLLSCVRIFATPWIAACQLSLSITKSQSSLRLTSIESVMPSSHLILCLPLLLLPSIFPNISLFQLFGSLHQVAKVLELQLQLQLQLCFNCLFYLQIKCADYMTETLTWLRVTFNRMRPSISPKHLSGRLKISKQIDLVM